ncbi:unnamed protein product [Rotaria socialis]|uniref:Uncharacterized protein n=1 Tax=Rotaria socialis TaxID=392032 RepID=A0A818DI40_9BILA|nr:unnamed protein product [Rotaria socialis]CAF4272798.1 unnamed protein product [Rotaria socialis]
MSIFDLLRFVYDSCRAKIVSFNLYHSQSIDSTTVHREILSTRLFIFLFGVSLTILTIYTSFTPQISVEKIQSPSVSDYERLQIQYSDTLQCQCQFISIPYAIFTHIETSFHQVCSSNFISQEWIDSLFENIDRNLWPMDMRTTLSAMWQLISTLCQISITFVSDAFHDFEGSQLISSIVLPKDRIQMNIQAAVNETQKKVSNTFLLSLSIIQQNTQINDFITGVSTNYILKTTDYPFQLNESIEIVANKYIREGSTTICTCLNKKSCPMPGNIYLYDVWDTNGLFDMNILIANETLPGLIVDCLPLQAMLASSFECFYNQSCLNILISVYSNKIEVQILNQSFPSRFSLTTSIGSIVDQLFIENIQIQTNYDSYYNGCAPSYCSYTQSRRFDCIYVITTLIALYGGLNVALYIITPYLIDLLLFIRKKISRQDRSQPEENITVRNLLWNWCHQLRTYIIELNFFDNYSDDAFDILRGRISTWLYIILLTTIMMIIIIFKVKSSNWTNVTVYSPSIKQYENLYNQYPNTLQCPCSNISIPYDTFIQVTPIQHQVCTSNFVQPWWYESISPVENNNTSLNSSIYISSYFQTMAVLCELTKLKLDDKIRQFSSTIFVSSQLFHQQLISIQANYLLQTLISSTITEFNDIFALISSVIQANQYISGRQTNTVLMEVFLSEFNATEIVSMTHTGSDNDGRPCFCAQNSLCNIETYSHNSISSTIPGLSFNCFIFDSVLESSLICWYDSNCLDEVLTKLMLNVTNITVLDDTWPSRFFSNSSIKTLLDNMMIEEWQAWINYTAFYEICHPAYCTFTYDDRHNTLYLITTMIGTFGGLDIVLGFVCLIVVRFLFRCSSKRPTANTSLPNNQEAPNQHDGHCVVLDNVWHSVRCEIKTYNLFKSGSNETQIIRHERYSTRVYLFLLSIGIFIIIISTISSKELVYQTIEKPTLETYNQLMQSYTSTLQCPCSGISISYSHFMRISTVFHTVCSSYFVSDAWLDFLFSNIFWFVEERADIRVLGSAYFNSLSTLCRHSAITIENAIRKFLPEKLITAQLMPINLI